MEIPDDRVDTFEEKRFRSRGIFHLHQRSTDIALWVPGVITLLVGAFIVWIAVQVSKVDGLVSADDRTVVWQERYDARFRNLESVVTQILSKKEMKECSCQ